MNIKELKELISDLPDDMLVGNSGHYGEFLSVISAYKTKAFVCDKSKRRYFNDNSAKSVPIFLISIEDAGEEPS